MLIHSNLPDTWRVLANSAEAVSGAADTNENTLATVSIPAGAMGANGTLRVTTKWTATNNANSKTVRYKLGGTQFGAGFVNSAATLVHMVMIDNRNAANSQIGHNNNSTAFGTSSTAFTTGTVDTSAAQDLIITAQKATGTDTMTLESYTVEVIHKD